MPDRSKRKPTILDAVIDQHRQKWIRCGSSEHAVWISIQELQMAEAKVFNRLSTIGATYLTAQAKNAFKEEVQERNAYTDALVASCSGYLGNHFVTGDGTVISPPGSDAPIIVAFEGNPKFTPRGTLEEWQASIFPIVEHQSLPLFALSYALIPPLLRFAPPDYLNPLVEIVGKRETGKSTIGMLAASIWAGDPSNKVAGGETWERTLNSIDNVKSEHAGSLLLLDEVNLAAVTTREQGEVVKAAVFKLAGSGIKRRLDDKRPSRQIDLATMSTSNTPLEELISASAHVRGAVESRMTTIRIHPDSPFGGFDSVPAGFSTSGGAMEHLRAMIDQNYGVAGPAFARRLAKYVARDEADLRMNIQRLLQQYVARSGVGSARVAKMFALTALAGFLACKWGIFPLPHRRLVKAVQKVHQAFLPSIEKTAPSSAAERVAQYVTSHKGALLKIADLDEPLNDQQFIAAEGFLRKRDGLRELLVPAARFQREFRDHESMLRELRANKLARTEGGKQSKLTIKTPRAICRRGRVYCIALPPRS